MKVVAGSVLWVALAAAAGCGPDDRFAGAADAPPAAKAPVAGDSTQVEQLTTQVKVLQGLVPDQAAVMTHLAYHYSNLWFAADKENWPLAEFYLNETRANLKWAVRAKPVRKTKAGQVVDLAAIAQALDNSQFTEMKKLIDAKDKPAFAKLYRDTLNVCYACHKASEKPYLRPQLPEAPESRMINFDPNATEPR